MSTDTKSKPIGPRAGRLHAPKKGESKNPAIRKVGFVGGLNKLRERQNNIGVDSNTKPNATRAVQVENRPKTKIHIQRQVLKQKEHEIINKDDFSEESSELETID